MQPININGVFKKDCRLFTENFNLCRGITLHNEKIISINDREFRSWNPYRSKFAAAILKGLKDIKLAANSHVLYLGAATGTTVSHVSDIVKNGIVYAVESSPIASKSLIEVSRLRNNIIPIVADANHPDRYSSIVSSVDFLYQDISQRNQAEIFIKNVNRYLKKDRKGVLMVKARSIDVSLDPKKSYELVTHELRESGLRSITMINLLPYEKDHAAIVISQ